MGSLIFVGKILTIVAVLVIGGILFYRAVMHDRRDKMLLALDNGGIAELRHVLKMVKIIDLNDDVNFLGKLTHRFSPRPLGLVLGSWIHYQVGQIPGKNEKSLYLRRICFNIATILLCGCHWNSDEIDTFIKSTGERQRYISDCLREHLAKCTVATSLEESERQRQKVIAKGLKACKVK